MVRAGTMMLTTTTAASLPPLNIGSVFGCCEENVDDAWGVRSAEGSDCLADSVVRLSALGLVKSLASRAASLLDTLKRKISVWYHRITSGAVYSGLEPDSKGPNEDAPLMLCI